MNWNSKWDFIVSKSREISWDDIQISWFAILRFYMISFRFDKNSWDFVSYYAFSKWNQTHFSNIFKFLKNLKIFEKWKKYSKCKKKLFFLALGHLVKFITYYFQVLASFFRLRSYKFVVMGLVKSILGLVRVWVWTWFNQPINLI